MLDAFCLHLEPEGSFIDENFLIKRAKERLLKQMKAQMSPLLKGKDSSSAKQKMSLYKSLPLLEQR